MLISTLNLKILRTMFDAKVDINLNIGTKFNREIHSTEKLFVNDRE